MQLLFLFVSFQYNQFNPFMKFSLDSHEECENCLETLTELENIDDDVERQKIQMLKTTDASFAEEVGVESYPALVFFKVILNFFCSISFIFCNSGRCTKSL